MTHADFITQSAVLARLTTATIGHSIEVFDELPSTNDYIKRATHSLQNGHTVFARGQSAGRGQFGKSFSSPRDQGIYMSIFLAKPAITGGTQAHTQLVAVAVCHALEATCNISPSLKWINDVVLNGKKLGGILCESTYSGGLQQSFILGIGINTGTVYPCLKDIATSLECNNVNINKNILAAEILNRLECVLGAEHGIPKILADYQRRLVAPGYTEKEAKSHVHT